jgi:4'-phosphopantetheinyl transferase
MFGAAVTLATVPAIARDVDWALLSDDEMARARRFAVEPARAAFVTARAVVRRLLAHELLCDPADVPLAIGENRRPKLDAHTDGALDFNLSHSGSMIAVIIARGRRVGIDVEWHGHNRGLRELVPTVMGRRETAHLLTQHGAHFTRAFLDCWTRKEALLKAHGVGLGLPLHDIDIPTLTAGHSEIVTLQGNSRWQVTTLAPQADYSLSIAMDGDRERAGVQASST